MENITNLNEIQRGTQTTGLSVMFSRHSPDRQHGGSDWHPANVSYTFSKNTNDDLRNLSNQRLPRRRWTREDNKFAPLSYFKSNYTIRGLRKMMIEICNE